MDGFIHYGMAAGIQAIGDADLEITDENRKRIGVTVGSGIGGITGIENSCRAYDKGGPRKISAFFVPGNIINMVAGNLSIRYGLKGPNYSIVSVCTSATHNITIAALMIRQGIADVMVAGGSEMATSPVALGGFASARALSTRNDAPEQASRPFDKDREGFVLSDGAGVLVLGEYETAKAKGAFIYAELAGIGMNSDAYHMTAPSENGEGARDCMLLALEDAGLEPESVDYINAHGTSTPAGDIAETLAIKQAFGAHAHKLAISSTKSMTGHVLGVAGGTEAIFCLLALRDQIVPPPSTTKHRTRTATSITPQPRARNEDRCRPDQLLRLRRHQRYTHSSAGYRHERIGFGAGRRGGVCGIGVPATAARRFGKQEPRINTNIPSS